MDTRVGIGLNVKALYVAVRLALVAEAFVAEATAPEPGSPFICSTHGVLLNIIQHSVLLQID